VRHDHLVGRDPRLGDEVPDQRVAAQAARTSFSAAFSVLME
jgi:hypothetical protein